MDTAVALAPRAAPASPTTQVTPSRKRNYEGEVVNYISPTQLQRTPPITTHSRPTPPPPKVPSTTSTDLGTTSSVTTKEDEMAKPKLTFAEKQVEKALKQSEKDEKERLKAEAKAKKEEDKARRDEEKKLKDEEKEAARKVKDEKKRERDAEKQAKEAEKQKKEAEALKKQRAQMRIGTFFGKPEAASTTPAISECGDVSRGTTPSRRSSITSIDLEPTRMETRPSPLKPKPDDKSFIMGFFTKENMELAPDNRFRLKRGFVSDELPLNQAGSPETINVRFHKRQRICRIKPVKTIMTEMNGSQSTPIDLTDSVDPLENLPYKYLFYREDVRPAYRGTYTRIVSPRKARRLAIQPAYKGLPDTDYDYDSEAEWAEPEEGDEEILDDDEKSEDGDGDEEMEDFLDDEGDVAKRQLLVGGMEPNCSGLCWEDSSQPQSGFDLSVYRVDVLHDSTQFPIDPYSTVHWSDIGKKSPLKRQDKSQLVAGMQPPRLPLTSLSPNSSIVIPPSQGYALVAGQSENANPLVKAKAKASGRPVKLVPPEMLPAFRAAVSGSVLTKVGLLEVLKTQFPKCTKDAIKHTVEDIAERRGAKEGEKKWVLLDASG